MEATIASSASELIANAKTVLGIAEEDEEEPGATSTTTTTIKLLYKGKRLDPSSSASVFPTVPPKTPKIMVLVTQKEAVEQLNSQRSDPTIRGFDREKRPVVKKNDWWGPDTQQDKNYKFCRFQACTWQSFGHRPVDSTPHDFAARELLERLATDPGIVAVLKERELVVGTLGEMDPIDDRLMRQKQVQGACLLGYNTNAGQRIDLKLRTDNLQGFRPYPDLAATLIHELSHNWVGEHNLLFWTNYGQMRAEYLFAHTLQNTSGFVVRGKTTAQLAGLPSLLRTVEDVYNLVVQELTRDMAQHGLHPGMIASAIRERCHQLEQQAQSQAVSLGGGSPAAARKPGNPREMALAAAERRAMQQQQQRERNERQQQQQGSEKKPDK